MSDEVRFVGGSLLRRHVERFSALMVVNGREVSVTVYIASVGDGTTGSDKVDRKAREAVRSEIQAHLEGLQ